MKFKKVSALVCKTQKYFALCTLHPETLHLDLYFASFSSFAAGAGRVVFLPELMVKALVLIYLTDLVLRHLAVLVLAVFLKALAFFHVFRIRSFQLKQGNIFFLGRPFFAFCDSGLIFNLSTCDSKINKMVLMVHFLAIL